MRVLAALALVAACGSKSDSHASQTLHVEIRGMQFVPAALHAHVGDLIVFTNKDFVPHTATAPGFFDSGPVQPGQSWTFAPTQALDYSYVCTFHPTMKAELVVQ